MNNNTVKYKNTNNDFVPQIPENWEFLKMRHIGNLYSGLAGKAGKDFQIETSKYRYVPFTSISNDIRVNLDKLAFVKMSEGEIQNQVNKDDILFLMSSETQEDIGKCAIVQEQIDNLFLNSFCKGFRISNEEVYANFLIYALNSLNYRNHFMIEGKGFTRINLKQFSIKNLAVALPPYDQQVAIANFLDKKCEQINQFIADKKQLINLLKEQRQSVIDEILIPNSDTWVFTRLKNIVEINKNVLPENTSKNYDLQYIDIGNVDSNGNISQLQQLKFGNAPSRARRIVKYNDILISTVRTYLRAITINKKSDENIICSTGYAVLQTNDLILPELLIEILRTERFISKVVSNSVGVSYPAITPTVLGTLELAYPKDINIQKEIIAKIKSETKTIDETIFKTEEELRLVAEYKEALISNAVTGQLSIA